VLIEKTLKFLGQKKEKWNHFKKTSIYSKIAALLPWMYDCGSVVNMLASDTFNQPLAPFFYSRKNIYSNSSS